MDRLAHEGASFTNCYAQAPYCGPSRCSMFTGLYPHTNGHRSLMHLLHQDERNLFQDLKEAGYTNVAYGKNDLLAQDAIPQSFDEVDLRVSPDGPTFMRNPWPEGHKLHHSFYRGPREGAQHHDMDWACIESALQFLDEDHDDPFCIYLPLVFAHPPYEVEEPFFSMHDRDSLVPRIPTELSGKRAYMQALQPAHCGDLTEDDFREIRATYYGMVSRVDYQLGRLIDRLKERGLYDDTIIVVFTDHGDYAGDYGMIEKFLAGFEDCLVRAPLIISGPGVEAGQVHDSLCEMTDLYPTLMDLLDLEPKHYHYGRSLVPLTEGEVSTHREEVFAEGGYHADEEQFRVPIPKGSDYELMRQINLTTRAARKAAMVRTDRCKYVYCPDDRDELYDLEADPQEIRNVVDSPGYAHVRDEMRERLLRWMLDTGDVLPRDQDPRGWH